jgi:hypothetical protein
MGSGSAPVGTLELPGNDARPTDAEGRIYISEWWTSDAHGVSVQFTPILDFAPVELTDDEAQQLALLLLKATAPANIPGNGYEAWAEEIRVIPAKVLGDPDTRTASQKVADIREMYERITGKPSPL